MVTSRETDGLRAGHEHATDLQDVAHEAFLLVVAHGAEPRSKKVALARQKAAAVTDGAPLRIFFVT